MSHSQVCFQIIVFNGEPWIEACIKSLLPYGPIVAVEGPVQYYVDRDIKQSTDSTREILMDLLTSERVAVGAWSEKDEMCNRALAMVPAGTTHLFCVDADEIWHAPTLKEILANLDQVDSVAVKPHTFFGGFERCIGGFELRAEWIRVQRYYAGARWHSHRPPTILDTDGIPFRQKRHWDSGLMFEHYSYVLPSQVKSKIAYYDSWNAGVIPNYFERVYRPWVLGNGYDRVRVESEFDGVHEWLPARRGDARTYPFAGAHPRFIERGWARLHARFNREVAEMREGRGI